LFRHIQQYHSANQEPATCSKYVTDNSCIDSASDVDEVDKTTYIQTVAEDRVTHTVQTIVDEGVSVSLIAGLRGNSSIPYNVLPNIVDSFNQICSFLSNSFETQMRESLTAANLGSEVITSVMQSMQPHFISCKKPFDFLCLTCKINKYFDRHPLYVAPQQVMLGSRLESHGGNSKPVYDSFQYVSIEETLKVFLEDPVYVNEILDTKSEKTGIVSDYRDGLNFKIHPFSDASKLSIAVQLFYDGMGTTNPLRGKCAEQHRCVLLHHKEFASQI
jgi:hypothetical protein